jgi:protein-disulfide isomerase
MATMRPILILLALVLTMTAPGWAAAAEASPFSGAQREEIDRMIGDYIRRNPEVILDAVRALQTREQAEQQQRQTDGVVAKREQLEHDPADPVIGNRNGEITVVEFFDYRCPYCKGMLPAILQLLKDEPRVRYVLKEFPILTPESRIASRAALAAWAIDKSRYFDLHLKMMETKGELNEARILDMAKSVGLDTKRLRLAMDDPKIEQQLAANAALAQAIGITGTPAFIVGNRLAPGAMDAGTLRKFVTASADQN